jgi:hypothetical protein
MPVILGVTCSRYQKPLYFGSAVAVAFFGLVVIAPERVDQTMMGILARIVTAFVAVVSGS